MKISIAVLTTILTLAGTAKAHVVFGNGTAAPGAYHVADLRIFHGCEGSPTIEVTMDIPDNVTRVRPRSLPGWDVSVQKVSLNEPVMVHGFEVTEKVGSVTWKGGSIPDFAYQQFEVHFMTPDTPGEALSFPVHQICEDGRLDWDDPAVDDESFRTLPEPAPFILITEEESHD